MDASELEKQRVANDNGKLLHLEAYSQMLASLFLATLFVVLGGTGVALLVNYNTDMDLPVLFVVAVFGAVGALFSALMRLYSLRELPEALINPKLQALRNKHLLMYAFTPIIIGFIASIIVYFAVLAGILEGSIFPTMKCSLTSSESCDSFVGLFDYGPEKAADYAKALVLGFISGFSERLVRDVLHTADSGR